jgi:condensin complex subunit 3
LTPEKAFLARAFTDYCVKQKNEARLEAALPEVTALAFYISISYNRLFEQVKAREAEDEENDNPFDASNRRDRDQDASWEAEQLDLEFVVGELFRIAVSVDYGDEIGRRKMFSLVREMIGQKGLPDGLVPGCLDILRKLTPGERDFIRLVVEVVQVMRDPGVDMDEEVVSRFPRLVQ